MPNSGYLLHVVAPDGIAQQLSEISFALCPDAGPNNVNTPLNANGNGEYATHYAFSAPVTQAHIDALFGAGLGATPGVKWARTDRSGMLQKRWDNETPDAVQYSFGDLLNECGLKLRVVHSEI